MQQQLVIIICLYKPFILGRIDIALIAQFYFIFT